LNAAVRKIAPKNRPHELSSKQVPFMLQTRSLIFGLVAAFLMTAPADAQALRKPAGWGAVVILEPLVLAHGGLAAPCNPRAAARADWGIDRIERLLQLADHQQRLLNDLKVAVMKASDLRAAPVRCRCRQAPRSGFHSCNNDLSRSARRSKPWFHNSRPSTFHWALNSVPN
jgi:hypothetical protein